MKIKRIIHVSLIGILTHNTEYVPVEPRLTN